MVTAADVTLRLLRAISKIKYMYRIVVLVLHDVNNTFFLRGAVGLCVLVCLGLGGGGGTENPAALARRSISCYCFAAQSFFPRAMSKGSKTAGLRKKKLVSSFRHQTQVAGQSILLYFLATSDRNSPSKECH